MTFIKCCIFCIIALSICSGEYNLNEETNKLRKLMLSNNGTYAALKFCFQGFLSKSIMSVLSKMQYILSWVRYDQQWPLSITNGQRIFKDRNCPVNNCFLTRDSSLFPNIAEFDVVLFQGPETVGNNLPKLKNRSPHQKYVFLSLESSDNYPVCSVKFDNFFNWTWTYKLNSDLYFGYIIIRDITGKVIGPKMNMNWMKLQEMQPIDTKVKAKLSNKTIAAAWFVSNCVTVSKRRKFVDKVIKEMTKYGLTLDIYGSCGNKYCPKETSDDCFKQIEKDYYFYFAFENSFSEDYVTEKLLNALQHYAVPVVYGAANYSRFMPDGIYLHALTLGVKNLVKKMVELINNKEKYYNYFKWHNHYTYHKPDESPETDYYCKACEIANNQKVIARNDIVHDFRAWWTSIQFRKQSCSINLNHYYP